MKYCNVDWSDADNWSDMRKRRRCDIASIWTRSTSNPFAVTSPSTRVIAPWSWNSLFGNLAGTVFNTTPGSIFGEWGTMVLANNWHLFNGTARLIYANGDFSTFAVDLRINACADALADFIIDWAPLSFLDGVQIDYYLNPVGLGAASFSDFFSDQQFIDDFDAGLARFAARLRARKPDWLLIAQLDQRAHTTALEDPLNGYFLEQYIGRFAPQASFAVVQDWIIEHAVLLFQNHPERQQAWIIEYRDPRSLATPPFGLTRDQTLVAHESLCQATGSYLSYARDRDAQYAGHLPAPGKVVRSKTIRPISAGDYAEWQPFFLNHVEVSDQNDDSVVRTDTIGSRDLYVFEALNDQDAEAILDVSITQRAIETATSIRPLWKSNGVERYGNDHALGSVITNMTDRNILCPSGEWDLVEFTNGTFQGGQQSTSASGIHNAIVGEVFAEIVYEVSAQDGNVIAGKAIANLGVNAKAFVNPIKANIAKISLAKTGNAKTEEF